MTSKTAIKMDAVLIESAQPEKLAEFYRQAFGLDAPRSFGPDHLGMSLANIYLGFDRVQEPRQGPGRVTVWFRVEDVEASFKRLVMLGATAVMEPNWEESPGEVLATLLDPEGNPIGLICPDPQAA